MDKLFKTVSMKAVDEVEGKVEAVFSNFNEVDSELFPLYTIFTAAHENLSFYSRVNV